MPESELLPPRLTRRCLLRGLGLAALGAAPWWARAADAPGSAAVALDLPLELRQLVNHIGISVPDVVASARFYSHLFDGPKLVGQVKPALRYSISFTPGAMAIGALRSGATRAFIDHFCVAAAPFDLAAWRARLAQEGVRFFAGGTFVEVGDIPVQLVGGHERPLRPAGSSAPKGAPAGGFHPMPPLYRGQPLVKAHGFEHVSLDVADVDASSALFGKLFGLTPHRFASGRSAFFKLGGIELRLEQAAASEKPSIASFGIRVSRFDRAQLTDQLQALGARIGASDGGENRTALRFADPDGIECELWA